MLRQIRHGNLRAELTVLLPSEIFASVVRFCAFVALAAAPLFMSACSVGPDFNRPDAPEDAGYTPKPLPEKTASGKVQGGEAEKLVLDRDIPFEWWELFRSPALNKLIKRAFEANPTLPAAEAALRQANELVFAQIGEFYPTVDGGYTFERQKVAGNLSNSVAPGVQGNGTVIAAFQNSPNNPTEPGARHNAPLFYNFHSAQLTLAWAPDVFGGNRRQVESLEAQAAIQRYQLEATYITLAANVVSTAIQEASLRGQIAATKEIIAADTKALDILRDQFRLGYAMRIDVAAQEATLAQAQATLPPLEKQFEQNRDLLRVLVGNLPNEELAETFDLDAIHLPQELPVSLPSKLVDQRPDVRAAEEAIRSANAQVGVAIANRLPQFPIGASYGGTATQFSQMFAPGGPFWTLIGGVTMPVFDGGTLLHRQRAADEALMQAAYQYRSAVLAAYQNVADTLHAIVSDADALKANLASEQAAKVTLDLTHRQQQVGYVNYLTLIQAETAYQQARLALVQAQAARYTDATALFQALGGGWWNRKDVAMGPESTSAEGKAVR
jgi:NodT family efflux transporter outer membrane factor (OMF) lipoprotein